MSHCIRNALTLSLGILMLMFGFLSSFSPSMESSISRFNRVIYLLNTRSQLYRKDQMPAAGRASPLRRALFPRQRLRGCDSHRPVTIVSFEISSGRLVASHRHSLVAEWSPPARQNGTLPSRR